MPNRLNLTRLRLRLIFKNNQRLKLRSVEGKKAKPYHDYDYILLFLKKRILCETFKFHKVPPSLYDT